MNNSNTEFKDISLRLSRIEDALAALRENNRPILISTDVDVIELLSKKRSTKDHPTAKSKSHG